MAITNLSSFPGTVSTLPDKPNLSGTDMKAKFEADCKTLWEKVQEIIPALNGKQESLTIPLSVSNGGTGATTKAQARENLGIYTGSAMPSAVASKLQTGDIYIYCPEEE